jgi:trimeric autotransporter adhesin
MGTRGLVTGMAAGTSIITATVGGKTAMVTVTVTASPLMSITLSPLNSLAPLGTSPQFMATGTYMNGTSADITNDVTWASSMMGVATISNAMGSAGRVTTLTKGTTSISATLGGVMAATNLTVTDATLASITITPANIKIAKTTKLQLQAIGTFTDMSTVDLTTSATWGTGVTATATVSNAPGEQGQVLGVAAGMTTVTATSGAIVGSTPIEVTNAVITAMTVNPAGPSVAAGFSQQFTATGTFTEGSTVTTQNLDLQATWGSSNTAVATISNGAGDRGLASGLTAGTSTISAVFNGVSGSTTLTVTAALLQAISVTPYAKVIAKGTTQEFRAIGIFSNNTTQDITNSVTWFVNQPTLATISASGILTADAPGILDVNATLMGRTGSAFLTITNAVITTLVVRGAPPGMMDPDVSIPAGTTHQFYAVGTFTDMSVQDLTSQVTWASMNLAQATIDATGLARGVAPGMPIITASFRDPTTNNTVAATRTMTVTGATLVSIALTPSSPTVAAGIIVQMTAMGTFSNGQVIAINDSVFWSTSAMGVATVSNVLGDEGEVQGVTPGMATITALGAGGVMASTTVTVSAAVLQGITVTPANAMIANGATQQYTAIGMMSDGTMPDLTSQVTWASSNAGVAGISNDSLNPGLATSTATDGMTTISAFLNGRTGSTMLTVQ